MRVLEKLLTSTIFSLVVLLFLPSSSFASELISPWVTTTSLPYLNASHVSLSSSNKIFSIGGSAVTGQSKYDVLSAQINSDGSLNNWVNSANPMPTALIFHSSAVKDTYVYILGGREENVGSSLSHVNKVFRGNLDVNGNLQSWTQLNSLPEALSIGAAVVVGDRLYFAGGFNNFGESSDVYMTTINADGTIGNWTSAGNLPEPLSGLGLIEHNGYLIALGGQNGSGQKKNKVYKTSLNLDGTIAGWQETTSLPDAVYRGGVVKAGSKVVTIAGIGSGGFHNKVFFADINNDGTISAWTQSQHNFPQSICCGAAAYANGYIYYSGGYNLSLNAYQATVYFTKISQANALNVSLLKQTSEPWQGTEYDSASKWSPSNPTINRWGCALTSATMVFNYHGYDMLPDGTTLDPGSLNTWLKNQPDGYVRNGLINWLSLSRLSRLATDINNITKFNALEYKRKKGEDKTLLTSDIQSEIPDILEEPGHFIVATGINETTFNINDPFYNRLTLNDGYSDTFLSMGRYVPSSTNLSYILLAVNEEIDIKVKDNGENSIGEEYIQEPIEAPDNPGQKSGKRLKMIYLEQPDSQNFTVHLSSPQAHEYIMESYLYDMDGNVKTSTSSGILVGNTTEQQIIEYDNSDANASIVTPPPTTYQNTIDDIVNARLLNFITKDSISNRLVRLINQAYNYYLGGNSTQALRKLQHFENILNMNRGDEISETAYQILLEDATHLKSQL